LLAATPSRTFLVRHSAGAHLVVLVAVDLAYLARNNFAPRISPTSSRWTARAMMRRGK
jgi:acetyl esterase/lipase